MRLSIRMSIESGARGSGKNQFHRKSSLIVVFTIREMRNG
jgi:hypothetical protein